MIIKTTIDRAKPADTGEANTSGKCKTIGEREYTPNVTDDIAPYEPKLGLD